MVAQTPSRRAILDPFGLDLETSHLDTSHLDTSHSEPHATGRAVRWYSGRARQTRADEKYSHNSKVGSCHCIAKGLSTSKINTASLQDSDGRRESTRRIGGYLPERTIAGVQKEHLERSGLAPHHQIFAVRVSGERGGLLHGGER
jgi:hypothetical protein